MIEVGSEHRLLITVDGNKAIDRPPKTITINRNNILVLTVYFTTIQCQFTFFSVFAGQFEASINASLLSSLGNFTVSIDDIVSCTACSLVILRS